MELPLETLIPVTPPEQLMVATGFGVRLNGMG